MIIAALKSCSAKSNIWAPKEIVLLTAFFSVGVTLSWVWVCVYACVACLILSVEDWTFYVSLQLRILIPQEGWLLIVFLCVLDLFAWINSMKSISLTLCAGWCLYLGFFLILAFTFKPDFLEVTLGQHVISQRLCWKHLKPVRHPFFADGSMSGSENTFKVQATFKSGPHFMLCVYTTSPPTRKE